MHDFVVIGAGSAGCVLAAELARREAGSVLVLEAGPSERHPLVAMPMGLIWLMKSRRDWRFTSAPIEAAEGRSIAIPRGRMVGGSGSINSMVWFRGRSADFDAWDVPGWSGADVVPAFEAVEDKLTPTRLSGAHPLSEGLSTMLGGNSSTPSPDYESAGVFSYNLVKGRRNSAARAFLRPARIEVRTRVEVDRLILRHGRAVGAMLMDGSEVNARKGVVLSAGALASPAILMRSGIGPRESLVRLGLDVLVDAPDVGENLHDHPSVGLHFEAPGSGYGLELRQWPQWLAAPFRYAFSGSGPFASPTVEGGAFFNARGSDAEPDVQSHFIPFYLGHSGSRYALKSGYFADVCLCRPKSRGSLRLTSKHGRDAPLIDLGLFREESDLNTMVAGLERLRALLQDADFGTRRAPEVYPGASVTGASLKSYVRSHAGTAYHPVGTVRMGTERAPVSPRLHVNGVDGLWVADASVMPSVTSANTNAPSMMIGWKGAEFIAEDAA